MTFSKETKFDKKKTLFGLCRKKERKKRKKKKRKKKPYVLFPCRGKKKERLSGKETEGERVILHCMREIDPSQKTLDRQAMKRLPPFENIFHPENRYEPLRSTGITAGFLNSKEAKV